MVKLWADSERKTPEGWIQARSYENFLSCIYLHQDIYEIHFGYLEDAPIEVCVEEYLNHLRTSSKKCSKNIYIHSSYKKEVLKAVNMFDIYRRQSKNKFQVFINKI